MFAFEAQKKLPVPFPFHGENHVHKEGHEGAGEQDAEHDGRNGCRSCGVCGRLLYGSSDRGREDLLQFQLDVTLLLLELSEDRGARGQ